MKHLFASILMGLLALGCGNDGKNRPNGHGFHSPILSGHAANQWGQLKGRVRCTKGLGRMQDLTFMLAGGGGGFAGGQSAQISGPLQPGHHPGGAAANFFGQNTGFGDLIYVQGVRNGNYGPMLYNVVLSLCIYRAGNSYIPHHGQQPYGQQPYGQPPYGHPRGAPPGGTPSGVGGAYEYVGPNAGLYNFSLSGGVLGSSIGNPLNGSVEAGRLLFFSRTYNGPHQRSFTRAGIPGAPGVPH